MLAAWPALAILTRMVAAVLLLTALAAGVSLAGWLPARLRLEERLVAAVPLGLAAAALLGFLVSLVTGLSDSAVVVTSGGLALLAMAGWWPAWRPDWRADWRDLRRRTRTGRFWAYQLVFLLFAGLLGAVFTNAFFEQDGSLYAGWVNIWGDWSQHLSQTTSFAYGDNVPPELTVSSGQKLTYPFLTNFLSAMLLSGGMGLVWAMKLPVLLLAIAGLGLLMALTRLLAGQLAAAFAPPLYYLAGGLGFLNFGKDLVDSHQSLGYFLTHLPHTYTQANAQGVVNNLNWINPIYAYLGPQRAFVFGSALLLLVLICLHDGIARRHRGSFLAAGLIAAALPLIHTHSLLLILLIAGPLFYLTRRHVGGRRATLRTLSPWAYFLAPVCLIALPQAVWLTTGVSASRFLRPQFGWVKYQDGFFWFWWKNLGVFFPLAIAAMFRWRGRGELVQAFAWTGVFVFAVINLWVFQPWDWDNTKFLVYAFLLLVPAVAGLLAMWARAGRRGAAIVTAFVVLAGAAGAIDVSRTLQPAHYKARLFSEQDRALATWARQETRPDQVFLTAQDANNPLAALAGRRIVLGYTGWLWSYGLEFRDRKDDVARMYDGGPAAVDLLRRYGVDYVVIGPHERGNPGYEVNEAWFTAQYPVAHAASDTLIFRTSAE